jgi:DNA-binding beta-propeller fold protein YncE
MSRVIGIGKARTLLPLLGLWLLLAARSTPAQIVTATVGPGGTPRAIAVNTATNKIYLANQLGQNVLVIDGATNASTVISTPSHDPSAIGTNPLTNTIYAANQNDGTIRVIDGATNTITRFKVTGGAA